MQAVPATRREQWARAGECQWCARPLAPARPCREEADHVDGKWARAKFVFPKNRTGWEIRPLTCRGAKPLAKRRTDPGPDARPLHRRDGRRLPV